VNRLAILLRQVLGYLNLVGTWLRDAIDKPQLPLQRAQLDAAPVREMTEVIDQRLDDADQGKRDRESLTVTEDFNGVLWTHFSYRPFPPRRFSRTRMAGQGPTGHLDLSLPGLRGASRAGYLYVQRHRSMPETRHAAPTAPVVRKVATMSSSDVISRRVFT